MPPKPTSNPARRKGPAFKPPRPVKAAAGTTASKPTQRAPPKPAARTSTSNLSKKPTTSCPSFRNASTVISSSSEPDDADEDNSAAEDDDEDGDVEMDNVEQNRRPAQVQEDDSDLAAIPPALLARLLHDGFEDPGVKIQKEAMAVVGKYLDTFVREAVARAAFEREDAGGMGVSDGFLQVEDLEKLAPQLVLDF